MTVRFRIRTSAGQELSFATHEMFEDFVRSGDLSMNDLVYDGDSGSWSPARTHPLVLEIEYAKEEAAEAAEAAAKAAEAPPEDAPKLSEGDAFGLELAPASEMMTPEAEKAAFVKRMDAERRSDIDFAAPDRTGITGFTMEDAPPAPSVQMPVTRPAVQRPDSRPAPRRPDPRPESSRPPAEKRSRAPGPRPRARVVLPRRGGLSASSWQA
ncbi:MAG: hypothetical protein O2958_12955 [Gemmatimonadetes bacterium]|nr:hypothetical protein [Gemmatimonadota bacterium]MDA1103675.1 hypothetical protein [Gemmatimonadota bacterium]